MVLKAREALGRLTDYCLVHHPRDFNTATDYLSNLGVDNHTGEATGDDDKHPKFDCARIKRLMKNDVTYGNPPRKPPRRTSLLM